MATQIHTCCMAVSVFEVVVARPAVESGVMSTVVQSSVKMPAKSHSARAEGFVRTARAAAALRRRRATTTVAEPEK